MGINCIYNSLMYFLNDKKLIPCIRGEQPIKKLMKMQKQNNHELGFCRLSFSTIFKIKHGRDLEKNEKPLRCLLNRNEYV